MISFRIFGIPVLVHPWFWITLALIGGGLQVSDSLGFFKLLMFILAGFISVLVHELGHASMIRRYGLPTQIQLIAFGGFASHPAGQLDRKQSFLVTAAGPAIQFILGLLGLLLIAILPIPEGSLMNALLNALVWVSFIWSILNCLPIYPMDGGQMLAAILGPQRQRYVHLTGVFVAVLIGVVGYFVLHALILSLFMGMFAYQNWQQFQAIRKQ
ncbi:MAG: site-2 protease family protein [Opitutaceae bacterium]